MVLFKVFYFRTDVESETWNQLRSLQDLPCGLLFWKVPTRSPITLQVRFVVSPSFSWAACIAPGWRRPPHTYLAVERAERGLRTTSARSGPHKGRGWRRLAWGCMSSAGVEQAGAPWWRGGTCSRCAGRNSWLFLLHMPGWWNSRFIYS